eukprot:316349_1
MSFKSLIFFVALFGISSAQCNGCSALATCDVEFVDNAVYGCGGIWENKGIINGQYLCADGYSICPSSSDASLLGLTYESCTSSSIPPNAFYASLQSSSGSLTCDSVGINDIFGCANPIDSDEYVFYFGSPPSADAFTNCGPLGAQLSTDCNGCWKYGWQPWSETSSQGSDELTGTRHLYAQTETSPGSGNWYRTTENLGGVLCCKEADNITPTPTKNPITPEPTKNPIYLPDEFSTAQLDRIQTWKSRSIYQVITDRFSKTDTSDTSECSDLNTYCGGTFKGIMNNLDYIQGLGYDTIWISPPIENQPDGYHGYWQKNLYEINSNFGSETEYLDLVQAIKDRDMYLMIDIVVNHMGAPAGTWDPETKDYDYSDVVPFNDKIYYHDSCNENICDEYCSIKNFNFYSEDGLEEIEVCRLAGLPDLDQSNVFVADTFCDWLKDYVINKWGADAIRIDTVPEVNIGEWYDLLGDTSCLSDDVFNIGEYFWGDPRLLGAYQPVFDSVFGYPMYYTIRDVFGYKQTMQKIDWRLSEYGQYFLDYGVLGLFTDNHDNNRWLCDFDDITNYKNALLFMHTFPGIPIGYYGTEQLFSGCGDPSNREALWTTGFDRNSPMYKYIAMLNKYRKQYEIYDGSFNVIYSDTDVYAFNRGDNVLIVLQNNGQTMDKTLIISNNLKPGKYCNVLNDVSHDCFLYKINDNVDSIVISIENGISKFYAETPLGPCDINPVQQLPVSTYLECESGQICVYVDSLSTCVGSNYEDCGSINNPWSTFQSAINSLGGRTVTIVVKAGIYSGADNINVHIQNINLRIVTESGPENTIIDCNEQGYGFYAKNAQLSITGLTVQNCISSARDEINIKPSKYDWTDTEAIQTLSIGGAFLLYSVNTELTDMIIKQNNAEYGGAIFIFGGQLQMYNSVLYNNKAINSGGGIVALNAYTQLSNTILKCNNANMFGGGLLNQQTSININHGSIISDNIAIGSANEVYCAKASINVVDNGKIYDDNVDSWQQNEITTCNQCTFRNNDNNINYCDYAVNSGNANPVMHNEKKHNNETPLHMDSSDNNKTSKSKDLCVIGIILCSIIIGVVCLCFKRYYGKRDVNVDNVKQMEKTVNNKNIEMIENCNSNSNDDRGEKNQKKK